MNSPYMNIEHGWKNLVARKLHELGYIMVEEDDAVLGVRILAEEDRYVALLIRVWYDGERIITEIVSLGEEAETIPYFENITDALNAIEEATETFIENGVLPEFPVDWRTI